MGRLRRGTTSQVIVALAIVYVLWGTTYLGIRVAVETMPPLLMAAIRFLIAGAILYPLAIRRGDRVGDRPTALHWRSALILGFLLLLVGNGGITLGEQYVPSGIAALLVTTVPVWMAIFSHLFTPEKLRLRAGLGIILGLGGVALLFRPGATGSTSLLAMALMLIAPLGWAVGSVYGRSAPLPRRALVGTSMEMLAGGAVMLVAAIAHGELAHVHLERISLRSGLALAHLIVLGSIMGYSAYAWLLKNARGSVVSTYAFVNPVVAVFLGWLLLGEAVTGTTLLAAAVIVAAVALIVTAPRRRVAATVVQQNPEVAPPPLESEAAA